MLVFGFLKWSSLSTSHLEHFNWKFFCLLSHTLMTCRDTFRCTWELQLKAACVVAFCKAVILWLCGCSLHPHLSLLCNYGICVLEFLKIGLAVEPHPGSEIKPRAGSAGSSVSELVCSNDGHSLMLGSPSQLKPWSYKHHSSRHFQFKKPCYIFVSNYRRRKIKASGTHYCAFIPHHNFKKAK